MGAPFSQEATWRIQWAMSTSGKGGHLILIEKKEILFSENNHLQEQHSQVCGRVSITGGFQDTTGQGAR